MQAFFDKLTSILSFINDNILWGIPMILIILGAGIFMTVRTRALQLRRFGTSVSSTIVPTIKEMIHGKKHAKNKKEKSISQFEAFSSAIAGTVGTGNIGEYVIYAGQNTADVEYLQNMLKDKVGITLKVVTDFELANYDRVIYLGNYDTVVEDEALYGLALRGKSLHLWSKVDANTKLSIDILGEYLAYAENGNGSAHIVSGTDIIRRNRGE